MKIGHCCEHLINLVNILELDVKKKRTVRRDRWWRSFSTVPIIRNSKF